jgi:hypothetical protein
MYVAVSLFFSLAADFTPVTGNCQNPESRISDIADISSNLFDSHGAGAPQLGQNYRDQIIYPAGRRISQVGSIGLFK